jgi:hypothetical protein
MFNQERLFKAMSGDLSRSLLLGSSWNSELCSSIVKMIIDEYVYYSLEQENKTPSELITQYLKYKESRKDYEANLENYLSRFSEPECGRKIVQSHIEKLKNTDLLGYGKSLSQMYGRV